MELFETKTFSMSTKYAAFTPKDVEREIRNTMGE